MKEQSHKSEMRAALRGDFERLKARRQSDDLVLSEDPAPQPAPPPAPPPAPVPAQASWLDRLRGAR